MAYAPWLTLKGSSRGKKCAQQQLRGNRKSCLYYAGWQLQLQAFEELGQVYWSASTSLNGKSQNGKALP